MHARNIILGSLGGRVIIHGDTHTAHQAIEFYQQTRRGLSANVQIRWVLTDSGFSEEKFLGYLEDEGTRHSGVTDNEVRAKNDLRYSAVA